MPRPEPDVCLAFTCSFCGRVSYWTKETPAPYCLSCRCPECLGLMAFQTAGGTLHSYCPSCIRAESSAAAVN